jgi:hypothetical protein
MVRKWIAGSVLALAAVATSTPARAQLTPDELEEQDDLETTHSVLQKTGLGTLAVTGALGGVLAVNHETAFGDGRCNGGEPIFGQFGCGGLKYVHFGFAATTLGLFVATEVVAEKMPISPYESTSQGKETAMRTLRWVNIGLFGVQPILGLLAANPGLVGADNPRSFSKVLRTVHIVVGGTVATTYTVNAAMQW